MHNPHHRFLSLAATVLLLVIFQVNSAPPSENNKPMLGDWGLETQHLSPSVSPGDDFFTYVNEGWIEQAQFPQGMPRMDSFTEVYLRSESQIQAIIEDLLAAKTERSPDGEQLAALYQSYMDVARIDALGLAPLREELDAVLGTTTAAGIARWMAKPLHNSVIGMGVDLDQKDPDRYILYLGQSGLGLPGREFYLSDEPPFPAYREAYLSYIEGVLARAQIDRPDKRAKDILRFETEIASRHWTPAQRRDRLENYHPMSRKQLLDYAPGFDWNAFLEEGQVADQKRFIVTSDSAIKETAALMGQTSVDVLRSYLAFHFIDNQAPYLSEEYRDANFEFFKHTLNGIEEQRPRNLSALAYVSANLGEVLGRLYVDRYFPPENKALMEEYIHFIRKSFRQRLEQSSWMDKPTKEEALSKLNQFIAKIGYPDRWQDLGAIVIEADDLIGNNRRIENWYTADSLAKLGEPRRLWEWALSPQTVNAYYSPTSNEIVFPAAILQPPFFDPHADPAVNFGAIGAVIGHEMGHGFDDQGSRSDGKGVLRDWWTEDARNHFEERTADLVEQYNSYEPIAGTRINGQLTLGENIGDLGGLTIAYDAYRNFLKDKHDGEAPVIDGMTGDQRFFMAWGQVWRGIQTEDFLRNSLLTNPHSPGSYRVNGIVRNLDAWYEAFGVTPEHDLFLAPEARARIW
ncbi:MAG: M13 family metallopeptidase [Halioglobus sp.]|nr:M13 family metallopeptidase [Halioglobus sp.]